MSEEQCSLGSDVISIHKPLITIVIPALNEEKNIPGLEQDILEVTNRLPCDFEFIVIDYASTDGTSNLIKEIYRRDARWKYIRFSRNFTVEANQPGADLLSDWLID